MKYEENIIFDKHLAKKNKTKSKFKKIKWRNYDKEVWKKVQKLQNYMIIDIQEMISSNKNWSKRELQE